MNVISLLQAERTTLSFEFFPPKDESASDTLLETVHELDRLNPAFVSVTYGAGGTTRERTRAVVQRIMKETCVPTIPHLTCIGHSEEEMMEILDRYAGDGVKTILALRGDPPRNQPDYDRSKTTSSMLAISSNLSKSIRPISPSASPDFPRGIPRLKIA